MPRQSGCEGARTTPNSSRLTFACRAARYHMELSRARAHAVVEAIHKAAGPFVVLDSVELVAKGFGGTQPIVDGNSPENQRVEINVIPPYKGGGLDLGRGFRNAGPKAVPGPPQKCWCRRSLRCRGYHCTGLSSSLLSVSALPLPPPCPQESSLQDGSLRDLGGSHKEDRRPRGSARQRRVSTC